MLEDTATKLDQVSRLKSDPQSKCLDDEVAAFEGASSEQDGPSKLRVLDIGMFAGSLVEEDLPPIKDERVNSGEGPDGGMSLVYLLPQG